MIKKKRAVFIFGFIFGLLWGMTLCLQSCRKTHNPISHTGEIP